MSCDQVRRQLDDYLDEELGPEARREVADHLAHCPDCHEIQRREEEMRRALRSLPAPATPDGLIAAGKARAAERERRRWALGLAGAAAAASLLLAVGLTLLATGPGSPATPSVAVTPGKAERVRLVFNSPERVREVTVTLELPEGVELKGYPGRKRLSWRTNLEKGRNLLELPVVLKGAGGTLRAGLKFDGHERRFGVALKAREPDRSALVLPRDSA